MRYLVVAAWIAVSLVACGDSDPAGDNNSDQQTEEGDRALLAEMRREIDALVGDAAGASIADCRYAGVGSKPCGGRREIDALVGDAAGASIADCRYAGVGSKPCGGPWEMVIYSVSTTDSTALAEWLTAYNAIEAEMNERYGYVSDCSVPNEPVLAYRDGRCVAE